MNYEMLLADIFIFFKGMAADTGDFRAFREIIACETLISGNLLYATYYAKVSYIQQHAQRSSEKGMNLQIVE